MLTFSVDALIETLGKFYYVLVYGIGIIAVCLSVSAYQFKHRTSIVVCSSLGQTCWVIYFVLQGDLVSAVVCGFSAIILALLSKKDRWKWTAHPAMLALYISVFVVFSLLTFRVWNDIFPLIAGIFMVIANSRSSEKKLRKFALIYCICCLLNSITKLYAVALVCDVFSLVSNIVSMIRYRDKK